MGRAKVISKVSGKPDWYLVEDDLGNSYKVQSAVDGFDYKIGEPYRLFTPGGEYRPCMFRLLPYKTGKRWRSISELSKDYPTTAVAYYLWGEKMLQHEKQDAVKTVSKVSSGKVWFKEGGCASVSDEGPFVAGDCVAVIHDKLDPVNPVCLLSEKGDPWVAGYGCDDPPNPPCSRRYEYWNNYLTPSADLSSGTFTFEKANPQRNEIDSWTVKVSKVYFDEGQPYGSPATVWAGDALRMNSLPIELEGISEQEYEELQKVYPAPIMFRKESWHPVVVSPPVIVRKDLSVRLLCGGKELRMTVNLLTQDTHNFSETADGGYYTGLQIPACMILVFSDRPWPDYIADENLNEHLYEYLDGSPKYGSPRECNLDRKFELVYTAPGSGQDFSNFRGEYPGNAREGQYGLYMSMPRRNEDGTWKTLSEVFSQYRNKFNVPMDDKENDFGHAGALFYRCFDFDGEDITPYHPAGTEYDFGMHPGYFEINRQTAVIRNIYRDFLAAFPFMANSEINPSGKLPSLSSVVFYVQGKLYMYDQEDYQFGANPSKLECQRIEFFYEQEI